MKFEKLTHCISLPRIGRYLGATGNKTSAVKLYKANLKVSQAYLPLLATLEVVLRNKINASLAAFFEDPNWIVNQKTGFMSDFSLMESGFFLKREVEKSERRIKRTRAAITHGRVISEQSFGFWTELFEKRHYKLLAGRPIQAFAHLPSGYGRREVSTALNKIRLFRNRLYHNEPICFNGSYACFQNAEDIHQLIRDVLGWMDPALLRWVHDTDSIIVRIKSAKKTMTITSASQRGDVPTQSLFRRPSSS